MNVERSRMLFSGQREKVNRPDPLHHEHPLVTREHQTFSEQVAEKNRRLMGL